MQTIIQYLKERFPVIPVLLFATGYAGLAIGMNFTTNPWILDPLQTLWLFAAISGIFVCFLFRQRVVDEFRDFQHDHRYFPKRPLHRGLVTKQQLIVLGISAFIIELLLVASIGSVTYYLPILLFNIFMAKDFFIKHWLDRHFTSHFFIHETFFLIFGWFFIHTLNGGFDGTAHSYLTLLVLLVAPMSVELIRKYKPRFDEKGKAVKDTYTTVWGRRSTLLFLSVLIAILGSSLSVSKSTPLFFVISTIAITAVWLLKKKDKAVIVVGAGQFILFALTSNLIW